MGIAKIHRFNGDATRSNMEATGMDPMQRHILETSYEDNRGQPGSFNALATFLFHSLYPKQSISNQQALSDMKQ